MLVNLFFGLTLVVLVSHIPYGSFWVFEIVVALMGITALAYIREQIRKIDKGLESRKKK